MMSVVFAGVVGWNLSQHTLAYLGLSDLTTGLLFGTLLSFIASAVVILMLLLSEKIALKSEDY
jgi:hypothetical protein